MISKETFVSTLNRCKALADVEYEVNNIFTKANLDFMSISYSTYEDITINLLAEAMNDKGDWIAWWVWECEWGAYASVADEKVDGGSRDIPTPEELYDYMMEVYNG